MKNCVLVPILVLAALPALLTGCPTDAPPTAGFSATMLQGEAPFTVRFADESARGTSAIDSWTWHFGDGTTSMEQHPTHTYAFAGSYTVALTVTSSIGSDTFVLTNYIVVDPTPEPPTAGFSADVLQGDRPLNVQFSDESDPGTSPIGTWLWDFGDGATSTVQNPAHTFASDGTYTVSLTVTSDSGSDSFVRTDYIVVLIAPLPPTAGFSADVLQGEGPIRAQFTDESDPGTSPIVSWFWLFGDGTRSVEQNPMHTFASEGTYTIALTVTSALGSDSLVRADYITVVSTSLRPTAEFSADVLHGDGPLEVQFTNESHPGTANIRHWFWDFGDGSTSATPNPVHFYVVEGTYSVSLTATSELGSDTFIRSDYITVGPCVDDPECDAKRCSCPFDCPPEIERLRGRWEVRMEFDEPVESTFPGETTEPVDVIEESTMYFLKGSCFPRQETVAWNTYFTWRDFRSNVIGEVSLIGEDLVFDTYLILNKSEKGIGTLNAVLTLDATRTVFEGEFSIYAASIRPVSGERGDEVTGTMILFSPEVDCADLDGQQPVLESVNPSALSFRTIAPWGPITIAGRNLTDVEEVTFDGYSGRIESISAESIEVIPPDPLYRGLRVVAVELRTADCVTRVDDAFEYVFPPQILDFSPKSGPAAGGDTITFYGRNLHHVLSVTVAGVEAEIVVGDGSGPLTVVTSPAPPGTPPGPIEVENIGGTNFSDDVFTYIDLIPN